MGRQLLAQEPVFRRSVDEVSELFGRFAGWSLLDELKADERASRMQETRVGQPAIFALQVGLAALWRSWGVEPAAVFGHSAGEMAATYIAGVLSLEERRPYVSTAAVCNTEPPGRAPCGRGQSRDEATSGSRATARLSIAAINGPNRSRSPATRRFSRRSTRRSMRPACSSRLCASTCLITAQRWSRCKPSCWRACAISDRRPGVDPFFSTVTGSALAGSRVDANYWYRNVRQPVLFHDTIAELVEAGTPVLSSSSVRTRFATRHRAMLSARRRPAGAMLCSLRRNECERAALLGSLGRLYTLGADIDWQKLYPTHASVVKLPSYPFQAEVHWRESDITRQIRLGKSVHPLLGNRLEVAKPSWSAVLDTAGLTLPNRSPHRRLDHIPRRRLCGDGAGCGSRDFRVRPVRGGKHRIPEIPGSG